MKRKRFSVEQIVAALKQVELGMAAADLISSQGIAAVMSPSYGNRAETLVIHR